MVIFWSFCPPKMIHRNTRYRDSTRTKNVVSVKKNLNVRETDSSVLVASLGYLFSRNNRNDYRVHRDERYHYRDNRNGYREAELVLANWQAVTTWQFVFWLLSTFQWWGRLKLIQQSSDPRNQPKPERSIPWKQNHLDDPRYLFWPVVAAASRCRTKVLARVLKFSKKQRDLTPECRRRRRRRWNVYVN